LKIITISFQNMTML